MFAKRLLSRPAEEFMKLVGEWGIELPDGVLDAVAGGYKSLKFVW